VTRRRELVARSAEQRAALIAAAAPIVRVASSLDGVISLVRRLPLLLTIYALLRRR
jgi:hypothetical protein